MSHGRFSTDNPLTEWVVEVGEDIHMALMRPFFYEDPHAHSWKAEAGYRTDGATIPRALWTVVGSPYTGNYRRAAIVHDVACDDAGNDSGRRRAADRMFYHACRAGGCGVRQSIILYLGVRIGGIWPLVPQWSALAISEPDGPRLTRTATEVRLESDFQRMGEFVLAAGESDEIEEVERRVDRALTLVANVDLTSIDAERRATRPSATAVLP